MLTRWWRMKMFNTKLIATNMMKKLRISVLVSVCPSGRMCRFSALFSALAGRVSGWTLLTQGGVPRVAASGSNLILVILAAGMFPWLLFQGVHPVILSISLSIALESCALNTGSPNGFPMGLVQAGGIPPLPLLPLPPLPGCWCLGSVVAGSLHLPVETLWYISVDWILDQSSKVDDM